MDKDKLLFYMARLANEAAMCAAMERWGDRCRLDRLKAAVDSFGNSAGAVIDLNALTEDECRTLRFSGVFRDGDSDVWRIPLFLKGAVTPGTRLYDADGSRVKVCVELPETAFLGCLGYGVRPAEKPVADTVTDKELKGAAARYAQGVPYNQDRHRRCHEDFIAGARWMEERIKNRK